MNKNEVIAEAITLNGILAGGYDEHWTPELEEATKDGRVVVFVTTRYIPSTRTTVIQAYLGIETKDGYPVSATGPRTGRIPTDRVRPNAEAYAVKHAHTLAEVTDRSIPVVHTHVI
jgi:hypothetical protein